MPLHAIVLAAGKGTRMKSDLAKVLHVAAGRTLLDWSLSALAAVDMQAIAVVVGHQAAAVTASIADHELAPLVATALQAEQLGTGHAAGIGLAALRYRPGDTIVVMPGDMPLLRQESLATLVSRHEASGAAATVLTARLDDPTGYGRVIRDGARVVAIVEQADASPEQLEVDEVNTSVYTFRAGDLAVNLDRLDTDNAQAEMYLTDVVGLLVQGSQHVEAVTVAAEEAMGVNTVGQLETASAILQARS